jgi:hypothetical protein
VDSGKAIESEVTLKNEAGSLSGPPLLLAFNVRICFKTSSGVEQSGGKTWGTSSGIPLESIYFTDLLYFAALRLDYKT